MINRYQRQVMKDLWSEKNRYDAFLAVELAASYAWNKLNLIDDNTYHALLKATYQLEDIKKIDNLSLDNKKHIVKRSGKEIYLTRKEFMLLEYLMKNRGNVLSRGMILEHVWDMNADPFSNTIESHILSLRKKINKDQKKQLIQTISGRGYKIE